MATTAVEKRKTRSDLAQLAGAGPISFISILAGVLVGFATFAMLVGGAITFLHHRGSKLDLTEGWGSIGARGGVLLGCLLFVSFLLAGYVTGRMAWRRGIAHGLAVFIGSIAIIGAVALMLRRLTNSKDVEAVNDALRSFGVPTTRDEWRHVGSFVSVASLGGMLLGSVLGGFLGERWFTKVSRRALEAEIDVRERMAAAAAGNGHGARHGDEAHGEIDLEELSKEELYQRAQEQDIPGRSHMSKDELKEALQG